MATNPVTPVASTDTHSTVCPLDCPDACSLEVRVQEGAVVSIEGTAGNSLTREFICRKVREFPKAIVHKDRVLRPLKRSGPKGRGEFSPVSWDEALDLVAEELLKARGQSPESILPLSYGGSNGLLSQDTVDARLFRRLGASRLARTVCAAPTGAAAAGLYGKMPGVSFEDYVHSKLIIVWGTNPHASGIHILSFIKEARDRGAKLVVVDPRRTKLAAQADFHLQVFPGTDVALALSMIRGLFALGVDTEFLRNHTTGWEELRSRSQKWDYQSASEVCGVPKNLIQEVTELYFGANPAVVRCGWGLERNRNGGSAAAAVMALPAVAGKFGVRGGGYTMSQTGAWKFKGVAPAAEPEPNTRVVNMNRVGRMLTDGAGEPIKHLFVYNCNPAMTLPEQNLVIKGLQRTDLFTVVFDSFMTDTAKLADVVLPAATFLERREVRVSYGALALQEGSRVIGPVGESRSNHEVFLELCRRTGLTKPGDPESEDEILDAWCSELHDGQRVRSDLARQGRSEPEFGARPVQFVDTFPMTDDGKVHLVPSNLDKEAPGGLYHYRHQDEADSQFPLVLLSSSTSKTVSSYLGHTVSGLAAIAVHPQDAAARGLSDGDEVRVFNTRGQVVCRAVISQNIKPGVAEINKGLWARHTQNGFTANALAPDFLTDIAGGACFNDAGVEIEKRKTS